MKTVPEIIREIRSSLEITQTEMARRLWSDRDPLVMQTYVSKYERGISDPPASVFLKIQNLINN